MSLVFQLLLLFIHRSGQVCALGDGALCCSTGGTIIPRPWIWLTHWSSGSILHVNWVKRLSFLLPHFFSTPLAAHSPSCGPSLKQPKLRIMQNLFFSAQDPKHSLDLRAGAVEGTVCWADYKPRKVGETSPQNVYT
mmetsp:Transcript_101709/g.175615  ORF Transcript_101709/g.175615 Transcript_101709/m.175615 type:complete len:136 (-) Transcript_101709:7-414(-)